jgi:glyoxylase-like metal-dependent hydrolase (beta-lactamase superfamily II)
VCSEEYRGARGGLQESCANGLATGPLARKFLRMNRREFLATTSAAVSLSLFARGTLLAQTAATPPVTATTPPAPAPAPVQVEFKELRRGVGLFTGRGGTIGWLSNKDALVAVDTQFAETAAKFLEGLPGRDGRMLDAVIDTHHHWDHTGGNATLRPVAKKLVAHETVPALQKAAAARSPQMGEPTIPDTLFADTWRLDVGDEVVSARHFGPSHTGGDIAVYFEKANVVHVGDLVFNRLYPVTDRAGGCHVRHWRDALPKLADAYPADAIYIFGHGNPKFGVTGTRADVLAMGAFLDALVTHVAAEIKAGKSKAEIVTRQNLDAFPDYRAAQNSRLPSNLGVVYDELTGA